MKLSIIIPCYNEERYIEKVLRKVNSVFLPCERETIVINDGSNDTSGELLQKLKEKINFKLASHEKNLGKGAAIKTGLEFVTGDLIIIQDADLEYNPKDIPLLLLNMNDEISAVYGNRGVKRWPKRGMHYVLGAKILTYTVNILYGARLKDVYTGYKLFNTKKVDMNLLKSLKSTGFEFEVEITCRILKNKGRIGEVPINYIPRNVEEGKHIGLKDAFKGFFTILRCFITKT